MNSDFRPYLGSIAAVFLLTLLGCSEDGRSGPGGDCSRDPDCTLPELCNVSERRCEAPTPVADGEPCQHDAHCTGGACLDLGQGPVCATPCDEPGICRASGSTGDAGASDAGVASPARNCGLVLAQGAEPADEALVLTCRQRGAGTRYLGEACGDDADCGSGLCHEGYCGQPCSGQCPGDLVCREVTLTRQGSSLTHDFCVRPAPIEVVELGAVDTPASGSQPVSFDVAAGVKSFVLFAEDRDDLLVGIHRLEGPDGTVWIDSEGQGVLAKPSPYFGTGTALVPGSDAAEAVVTPGQYRAWVQTYDPENPAVPTPIDGDAERVALVIRRWGRRGGLLDMNIHLAPGTGLTAAEAADSAFIAAMLARLEGLYRDVVGLALGEVRFFDLPEAADALTDAADARALVQQHASSGPQALSVNVMFVQTFELTGGLAGGAPGVPGLIGRPGSGIVVAKENRDARGSGTLLAHELGHFLGLFHPSELRTEGSNLYSTGPNDIIEDTPGCPVDTTHRNCPDYHNLMFPRFPSDVSLTAGQAQVVRGVPWLYQLIYPEVCGPGIEAIDLTQHGFGSDATGGASALAGSCGGDQQGERVHLLRLSQAATSLEIEVRAQQFAPVVYVWRDDCPGAEELSCAVSGETRVTTTVETPTPGSYFIVVDGDDGAGRYEITARVVE